MRNKDVIIQSISDLQKDADIFKRLSDSLPNVCANKWYYRSLYCLKVAEIQELRKELHDSYGIGLS